MKEWTSFLKRLVRNPKGVGALTPSGRRLARAVATQVRHAPPGRVLELGPGTGAFTRAMIAAGIPPRDIIAVEADAYFAQVIRTAFPAVHVVLADAFDLSYLDDLTGITAVVSGIPLLNYPRAEVGRFAQGLLVRLPAGTPFIQFSYGVKAPIPSTTGFRVRCVAQIWRNLPPAKLWVVSR